MTGKNNKLNQTLVSGMTSGGKSLAKGLLTSLPTEIADKTLDIVNAHMEKHKQDVKVPDLTGLTIDEAEDILTQFNFKHSRVLVEPHKNYRHKKENIVLRSVPKPNTSVVLGSFIKLYYIDAATIDASQKIIEQQQLHKQQRQANRQAIVNQTVTTTKSLTTGFVHTVQAPFQRKQRHHSTVVQDNHENED